MRYVFLNIDNLSPLAERIRAAIAPETKIILLSHGFLVTDLLHEKTFTDVAREWGARISGTSSSILGRALVDGANSRRSMDLVVALSAFDAAQERWLGARSSIWLPRTVSRAPLDWAGSSRVLGFVGTLEHVPNLHGIVSVLASLAKKGAEEGGWVVEIVGGPEGVGKRLEHRFPMVRYLGRLEDARLRVAACQWAGFLNPVFLQAQGASTKLATALSWEIPVVTTALGSRGYRWSPGTVVCHDTPGAFAEECLRLDDQAHASRRREDVRRAARSCPSIGDVAEELTRALEILNSVA